MDLRKEIGGKIEAALNKLIDEKMKPELLDGLKGKLHEEIDKLWDKHVGPGLVEKAKEYVKKLVDKIDGEVDAPAETVATSKSPAV